MGKRRPIQQTERQCRWARPTRQPGTCSRAAGGAPRPPWHRHPAAPRCLGGPLSIRKLQFGKADSVSHLPRNRKKGRPGLLGWRGGWTPGLSMHSHTRWLNPRFLLLSPRGGEHYRLLFGRGHQAPGAALAHGLTRLSRQGHTLSALQR